VVRCGGALRWCAAVVRCGGALRWCAAVVRCGGARTKEKRPNSFPLERPMPDEKGLTKRQASPKLNVPRELLHCWGKYFPPHKPIRSALSSRHSAKNYLPN